MYGVWLASLLAPAAAQVYSTDPICVGMIHEDVNEAAGEPVCFIRRGPALVGIGSFSRTDFLGGVKHWDITLPLAGGVTDCQVEYHPFARCPPWLDMLRDALAPIGK